MELISCLPSYVKINVLIHVCIFNDQRRGEEKKHDKLGIQSAVFDNMLMILVYVLNLHLSSCIKQRNKKNTHTNAEIWE